MSSRITKPMRWRASAAFVAFLLLTIEPAMSAGQRAGGGDICAEREILLETLVEAHGNAGAAKLAQESIPIMQARAACNHGHVDEAVVVYDRLIAEFQSMVVHRGQQEHGVGDASH